MNLMDISRECLHTRILSKIQQEQSDHKGNNREWQFSIQTASKIIDFVYHNEPRRSGRPVLEHLYTVAGYNNQKVITDTDLTDNERIIALLHDLFEDTQLTLEDARSWGVAEEDLKTLDCLTRRVIDGKKEPRFDYIRRVATDPRAIKIKLRDSKDNLNPSEAKPIIGKNKYIKVLTREYLMACQKDQDISIEKFIVDNTPENKPHRLKRAFDMVKKHSTEFFSTKPFVPVPAI